MRVDYQFNNKTWSYLHYNQFSVGSSSEEYPLTVGGYRGGSIPNDQGIYHNGVKFSTPDNDNDKHGYSNCAARHRSGWWYHSCHYINFNEQPPYAHNIGGMIFTEMKIRPKDCITQ